MKMPTVESAGGESIVRPTLHVDIDPADTETKHLVVENWNEIQAARDMALSLNATLVFPAGKIYASAAVDGSIHVPIIALDDRHSGTTIRGAGPQTTVLADPYRVANADVRIQGRAIGDILISPDPAWEEGTTHIEVPLSDVANYQEDEVIHFWIGNVGVDRTTNRQQVRITAVNPTTGRVDFTPAMSDDWNRGRHAKGFEVTGGVDVGDTEATLTDSEFADFFKINDDMIIGDGPGFNEFYGEFVTVTNVSGGTISFHPPARRKYLSGVTCLIPPPHLTDITLRDFAFAGPVGLSPFPTRWTGFFKYGRRLRMENFDIVKDGEDEGNPSEIGFFNCGEFFVSNCHLGNLAIGGASHDGLVDNIIVAAIGGEEYSMDMRFSRIVTSSFFFSGNVSYGGWTPCVRIVLTDSLLNGATRFGFTDESQYSNIQIVNFLSLDENPPIVYANADNTTVENITCDVPIRFRGQNWRIANVTAPSVTIEDFPIGEPDPTTGVFLTPLNDDPTAYVDSTPAGRVQRPLLVNKDGTTRAPQAKFSDAGALETPGLILTGPAADKVPLKIVGHSSQSVDLQRWQSSGGTIFWSIRSDGEIATNKSIAVTSITNPTKAIKVVDPDDGSTVGYLALYQSVTVPPP
jgi:hypothetical protein